MTFPPRVNTDGRQRGVFLPSRLTLGGIATEWLAHGGFASSVAPRVSDTTTAPMVATVIPLASSLTWGPRTSSDARELLQEPVTPSAGWVLKPPHDLTG